MATRKIAIRGGSVIGRRLLIGWVFALLCLFLPVTVGADAVYQGSDTCAQCHPAEAASWQNSPHGQASDSQVQPGATCEVCHGAYVPNHPQEGMMEVHVGGSCCQDCHSTTYQQWHDTAHAGAHVECTSCHLAHTQDTRLTDESLCGSCHREYLSDFTHTAHHNAGVTCADCHLSSCPADDVAAEVYTVADVAAPDHGFTVVSRTCADCHGESIHVKAPGEEVTQVYEARVATMTEHARELANELEDAERANRSMQTMAVVSLGLGLGVGGMLGAIFVCVVGYISQKGASQ